METVIEVSQRPSRQYCPKAALTSIKATYAFRSAHVAPLQRDVGSIQMPRRADARAGALAMGIMRRD